MNSLQVKKRYWCSEENCIFLRFFRSKLGHLKRDSSCLWEVTAMSPCKLSKCPDIFPRLPFLSLSPASLYIQLSFPLPLGSSHRFLCLYLCSKASFSLFEHAALPSAMCTHTEALCLEMLSPGEDLPCAPSQPACCQATQHHMDFTPKLQHKLCTGDFPLVPPKADLADMGTVRSEMVRCLQ